MQLILLIHFCLASVENSLISLVIFFLESIKSFYLHGNVIYELRYYFFLIFINEYIKRRLLLGMEKAMAPHTSTLAWKIPWAEEPGRLQSMRSLELDTTERLHFHFSLSCIGEGNGNPLQCSCLENPRDGGSWGAAVYGVTQSRTRLK